MSSHGQKIMLTFGKLNEMHGRFSKLPIVHDCWKNICTEYFVYSFKQSQPVNWNITQMEYLSTISPKDLKINNPTQQIQNMQDT